MRRATIFVLLLICVGCLDPYAPPASNGNLNALVIDGYIDLNGTASVTLSRSIPLDGRNDPPKETGAVVTIESSKGEKFNLKEDKKGLYSTTDLPVDKISKYTLRIQTTDNEYESDAMQVYSTPSVDSIYWVISPAQTLEIRTDSHNTDPNSPKYYLLYGIETYEYHAPIFARYTLYHHTPVIQDAYVCYKDIRTGNVIVSTKGLDEDRITFVKLSDIERSSPKISMRYSMLLRQRALSEEEYTFQRLLLSTTEQQASLFAQIPGALPGNVRSVKNPNEFVLGYFSAQELKEYRFFIDDNHRPLPRNFYQNPGRPYGCQPEFTCGAGDRTTAGGCIDAAALSDGVGILVYDPDNPQSGYEWAFAECTNCALSGGGDTKKPPFWK